MTGTIESGTFPGLVSAGPMPPGEQTGRFRILFVCTGNMCRSVIAERLAVDGLCARLGEGAASFGVTSAGTAGVSGAPIHPLTANVLGRFGVPGAGLTSRRLTERDIDWADLILSVGREHRDRITAMRPRASQRAYLLREFARLVGAVPGNALDPVHRAHDVVAAAARMRGRVPYVEPGEDDIPDPRPTYKAFAGCADAIHLALQDILDAFCGWPVNRA
jgi:low molecular weight protein-tyrosine phosphatase